MWIHEIILGFLGICAGFTVAGGFIALITLLGVIPRLSGETKTAKKTLLYENFLILGFILGNITSLYSIRIPFGTFFLILESLLDVWQWHLQRLLIHFLFFFVEFLFGKVHRLL